jgi:hypothetical protein
LTATIGIPTTEVCYSVTAATAGFLRTGITTPNCAISDYDEDTSIDIIIGDTAISDNDGGAGLCSYTDVAVAAGDVAVVCFYEGPRFGTITTGNAIADANIFIELTAGPLPTGGQCRNDRSDYDEAPFLPCAAPLGCFDNRVTGATLCLARLEIPSGGACTRGATNESCAVVTEDCLVNDLGVAVCSGVTELPLGAACVAESETNVCVDGLACVDGQCIDELRYACLMAPLIVGADSNADGVFTATHAAPPATPGELSCGFVSGVTAVRYTANVAGFLRLDLPVGEHIAVFNGDCNVELACEFPLSPMIIPVVAGQTVVVMADGGSSTENVNVVFSNGVGSLVPAGGQCPRFDDDSCAEGLVCNGATCEAPITLAVPSTTAFTVAPVAGAIACFKAQLSGTRTISTSGDCATTGDSVLTVSRDGEVFAEDDDSGAFECSQISRDFPADVYDICVAPFDFADGLSGSIAIN